MLRQGIATPEILYSGTLARQAGFVIVLPFIDYGVTALQLWSMAGNDREQHEILSLLMRTLATHHRAGIMQRDLHLGNFLVKGEQVYALDGSDITISSKPLGLLPSLDNLGLLWAQFFPEFDRLAETCLPVYCRLRDWAYSEDVLQALKVRITMQRQRRRKRYLKKIFRQCSAVVACRDGSRRIFCDRNDYTETMSNLLLDPDSFFQGRKVELLKDGNSSTVIQVKVEDKDLVLKRYNVKSFGHGVKKIHWRNPGSEILEECPFIVFLWNFDSQTGGND